MKLLEDYFENISYRLRNENDLSDITWALCSAINKFQEHFLKYCFDENINNIIEFVREYQRKDCRLDFFIIDNNENEYFIEVKIYDQNNHFEQYEKVFPNAKKSYIANYNAGNRNGWKIKNWKEFIKYLENNANTFSEEEKYIIQSYITYVKSVINFVEVKSMDLSNISSIKDFYNILQQVVEEYSDVKLNDYNQKKDAINCNEYGRYLWYETEKTFLYFWIGLHFEDEKLYILIEYKNSDYCPSETSKKIKSLKTGVYFDEYEEDDPYIWIPLKDEYMKKLCTKIEVEKQKDIIKCFLEEVLHKLK